MLAIVCPGQGAQRPGFLTPWLEIEAFRNEIERFSDTVGLDLAGLGSFGSLETITATNIAQPLLTATALASARLLPNGTAHRADVIAGHSVGEIAAATLASVFSPDDAMRFVNARGQAMAAASEASRSGMAAIIGGNLIEVLTTVDALGLTPANFNGDGQLVVGGTLASICDLRLNPPPGTRIVELNVAGAFHTSFMASARAQLEDFAVTLSPCDPATRLITNSDGSLVTSGARYVELLVSQITSSVRWSDCMATMSALGVTGVLELPPAGTLVGIIRRNMVGVETFTFDSPDQTDAVASFISRHTCDQQS